jgi:hypothetical protein
MRVRSRTSSGRAAGLTLIEVVAGLALLSTLLVAVLTTKAKLTRQWSLAQQRLRAAEAADALLTAWWHDPATFPRHAAGAVPGHPGLRWRTSVVPNEPVNRLQASVVRLEVFGGGVRASAAEEVLAAVEVVLNDERSDKPSEGGAGNAAGGGR